MKQFKKIFVALLLVLGLGLASCKKDTTLADAKAELKITYTEGQNITLPASLGDVVITWESDNPTVIKATGEVIQGSEAVEVKLTATLTYKGKTETKYFTINVPKGVVPGAAKAALVAHYANTLGSATYKVTANVELITTIDGVSVTWNSDNPDFFSNTGVVTIPTYAQGNQSISLKATLGDGTSHTFRFNLIALEATTEELIEEALDLVTTKPAGEFQTQDFVVMNTVTIAGTEVPVTWTTSDEAGMTADGKLVVFYEPTEKNVTLTASITYNDITLTRDVVFKVKSSQKEENFYAALIPENRDKQVMVEKVSYFGNLGTDGFYMVDSEGCLAYFYGKKPANVVEGQLYNVIAKVAVYYGAAQFTNFTFIEIEGAVNVAVPVEVTIADIAALDKPANSGPWAQHSYYTLKNVKVRISGTGDYNTHLVTPDLAADATLDDTNSVIIYYKSNIEAVRLLDGKVIDEIQLINNGYRTDHKKWNFNFLGTADDILVTLTPAEIVENVKAALQDSLKNAYYKAQTIELPTETQGARVAWVSDNSLINAETGAVTMPEGAAVNVKLTATITAEDVTEILVHTAAVGPLVAMNIADFAAKTDGYIGKITGVVTGISANRVYMIEDTTGGIAIYSSTALEVGKQVTIVGAKTTHRGLHQINKASDVDIVTEAGVAPPVVELPNTVALTAEGLLPYQSRRLTISGEFTITNKEVDKFDNVTLTLKRGEEIVTLKWDSRVSISDAAKAHINGLTVEQKVKLVGALLGWNNGPLFGYDNESQLEVIAAANPLDQANEVLAALTVPETITDATALNLPTSGNYEAVIAWVSSHPEVIAVDGTVVLPTENMTVTLTATVTVGEAVVSNSFDVRIKVVDGTEIIETYALETDASLEITGVVIAIDGTKLYVQDETAAIYVYNPTTNTAVVGDKVKVVGVKGNFRGLHQVAKDATVEVLSSGNSLPEPTTIAAVTDLVETLQSQRINMNDLTVVSVSGQNLIVTDGTTEITVRSNAKTDEVYDHLQTAVAGQKANIKGMLLGWYNSAQFIILSIAELELLEMTDEQKVDADMAETTLAASAGPENLTLPTTGAHGSAITWESSNAAIIGNDGVIVNQPETDTEVIFTGTFVLNAVTKAKEYTVLINGSSAPAGETFTETFEASTATASYGDGSFVGVNGVTWTFVHSRDEGDYAITGAGIMLRRADEPSSLSATFTNGVKSFSFEIRKAFTGASDRKYKVDVTHNGVTTTYDVPVFGSGSGEQTDVITFTQELNLSGEVTIKIYASGSKGNQQATVDNFTWTTKP